jgi:protein SCO1/2
MTISFDTEYDTPKVLEGYAKYFKYDPKYWTFVTGDPLEINAIGDQVGEYFGHDETGAINHNVRTVVVNARGKVQKIYPNNKWTTDELMAEIVKAAKVK